MNDARPGAGERPGAINDENEEGSMDTIRLEAAEPAMRPLLIAVILAVLGAVFLPVGVYLIWLGDPESIACGAAVAGVGVWSLLAALGS